MGIDTISPDEQKLLDSMAAADRDPEPASSSMPEPPEQPAPSVTEPEVEPGVEKPAAPEDQRQKTVPHQALHEERERRKAVEKEFNDFRAKEAAEKARIEERLNLVLQAAQQRQQPQEADKPPELPPFAENPQAWIEGNLKALQARQDRNDALARQISAQEQQRNQLTELRNWGMADEASFAAKTPDYNTAMAFLREARSKELRQLYPGASDAQILGQIGNETMQVAMAARQQGRSLGEILYGLANGRGYAAPSAQAKPAEQTAAEKAAIIERGHQMAATVGTAGAAPRGELTAEKLATMSDDEFAAAITKMGRAGMHRMFGE